ncbi:hypothetical protein AB9F42_34060, partial [Rhizobium leguminosarum]|uniref:hypothetical protein n=1 Tax=Rhizobium leguminosarum TaxID=384 RepID=UPI003F991639
MTQRSSRMPASSGSTLICSMPAIKNLSEIAAQAEPAFLPQPLEHCQAKRKPEKKSGQSAQDGKPGDNGRHRKPDAR